MHYFSCRADGRVVTCAASLILIVAAAQAVEPPTGIYVSAGPSNMNSDSVADAYADLDFIDGVLVRIGWGDIETAPGQYDWSVLDRQFDRAAAFDLDIALGITNGKAAPAWLEDQGADYFDYIFRPQTTAEAFSMPVPWDEVYLQHWAGFIQAVGDRYADHPALSLVHITHSSGNGFEMQIPGTPTDLDNWDDAGYTAQLHADAITQVIDAFAFAFPDTPLDLEVHPVLSDPAVAQDTVAHGQATLGDRFGVLAAWWSQNNADNVYPDMYDLLQDAADLSFANIQLVGSATDSPDRFGEGGFEEALRRGLDDGVEYFEVWHNDVLNPDLQPLLQDIAAQLVPEPASATLMLLTLTTLARRQR